MKKTLLIIAGLLLAGGNLYAVTESVSILREDCTGYSNCYESLYLWESARQRDLIAADEIETVRIEGTWVNPDTFRLIINGWTTDADHYIRIYTASETRHSGVWDNTKYRMEVSANYVGIEIKDEYVRLEGLQISQNQSGSYIISISFLNDPNDVRISNCIIRGTGGHKFGIFTSSSYLVNVSAWNNIIYGASKPYGYGIKVYSGSTGYIYNNTINGSYFGIGSEGNAILRNNIVQNSISSSYLGVFNSQSNYNISDDSTSPGGAHDITEATVIFEDEVNNDFHLSSIDTTARDSGLDLSADPNLDFTDDIDGDTRSGAWDIGADETAGLPVNQPPAVNAGADQNIKLPTDTILLDGTVTDDELPGGTLITTWNHTGGTGTGTVTFADPGAVDTTAVFTADPGTYILRLTADDTELTSFSEMMVTVLAQPVPTSIVVSPGSATLLAGDEQQFTAQCLDQYGDPIAFSPAWSATGGTINSSGLYTAGSTTGQYIVTCTDITISGEANVTIIDSGHGTGDADTVDGKHASDLLDKSAYDADNNTRVDSAEIADIAADADKLDGQDSTAFATANHNHDAVYRKKIGGIAIVAVSGGDYTDPVAAMNDVNVWCGIPSISNTCLLTIMPGVYDIGTNTLQMQRYVDIEGSGENITRIKGSIGGSQGVVSGMDDAEVRFITIENSYGIAMINDGVSPKMMNITAVSSGGDKALSVYNILSSSLMNDVTAIAYGGNLESIGVKNVGSSSITIDYSEISGTSNSIFTDPTSVTYVGNTRIDGLVGGGGITKCVGAYDGGYNALDNACQPIP